MGQSSGKELGVFKESYIHGGRGKPAHLGKKIGEYVKHIFRGHNQEADHLAKMGADGMKKITVEKDGNDERWKEVRGFLGR